MFSQSWNQAAQKFDTTIKRAFVYQGGVQLRSYAYNLNPNTMQWQPNPYNAVLNYYYDMIPNNTTEVQPENSPVLYPNPAESMLNFRSDMCGKRYNIMGHDGRMLQSGVIGTNNQILIQNLSSGIYSIVVENGHLLSKTLFIKQ
jgi:hypothetical protein